MTETMITALLPNQYPLSSTKYAVLRTLGIPSRPLSNFASAHDTQANRAIDYYYDESYNPISHLSGDSIWWALTGWARLLCARL